jgi:Ni,Fe-hydrogenase III large subunit
MATPSLSAPSISVGQWRTDVLERLGTGERFAGLYGTSTRSGCDLSVLLATSAGIDRLHVIVPFDDGGRLSYRSLSPDVPAAFWYERALHDLSGVVPIGHPRLDPLLLHVDNGSGRPRPGHPESAGLLADDDRHGPADVTGRGIFTIPFGPVRSGVFESVEFLIETPGEDIPHLNIRPHFKHRGIAKRFEGLTVDDGVLVAERVEGIASVAHALAFSHAVERLSDTAVPRQAQLVRVVMAEFERIANHLDVAMRLTDAAGLAVGTARFSWHKEAVMRLVSQICGSRFGRGVVIPGGVRSGLRLEPSELARDTRRVSTRIRADAAVLMNTASFLDRLRNTGILDSDLARRFGALGPIGRGSGFDADGRRERPYDGYAQLQPPQARHFDAGDAMARLRVRWAEIDSSIRLVTDALAELERLASDAMSNPVRAADGYAAGWAEAPQGEVLYALEMAGGRIRRCLARSASFHNLPLFHDVFDGDVLTDFAFIEASFGLSYAAVAM